MNVEQAITRIKVATHDISDEYSDNRCIEFLNTAIQEISGMLVAAKFPGMVQEMQLHNGDRLPDNYMHSCGTYPVRVTDGSVTFLSDEYGEAIRFRYYANPSLIELVSDDMPFAQYDQMQEVIVKTAIILALNENEYDISQDTAIRQELLQAIAGGMGANITGAG